MINFPLYEMRKYVNITEEGAYKIILTHTNKYVLDTIIPWANKYSERRMDLLSIILPYDLYPINKRIENLSQLINTKCRKFIDSTGGVVTWKPTKFYEVQCIPIISTWRTPKGGWGIEVKGLSTKFIVSQGNYKYAQVVKMGNRHLLFNLINDRVPNTRKKI